MSSDTLHEAKRPLGVLLVEDDPGDVLIAQEALAAGRLSTELHVVNDGAEAIDYLRRTGAFVDVPRPDTWFCGRHLALFDKVFEVLYRKDEPTRASLAAWLGVAAWDDGMAPVHS